MEAGLKGVNAVSPDAVYSVSVDGSGTSACSGGKDDQGLVWKVTDGSLLFQCKGMKSLPFSLLLPSLHPLPPLFL